MKKIIILFLISVILAIGYDTSNSLPHQPPKGQIPLYCSVVCGKQKIFVSTKKEQTKKLTEIRNKACGANYECDCLAIYNVDSSIFQNIDFNTFKKNVCSSSSITPPRRLLEEVLEESEEF
jgi:hypothetical protein